MEKLQMWVGYLGPIIVDFEHPTASGTNQDTALPWKPTIPILRSFQDIIDVVRVAGAR